MNTKQPKSLHFTTSIRNKEKSMRQSNSFIRAGVSAIMLLALSVQAMPGLAATTATSQKPQRQGIVLQVSDNNPATWNMVLAMAEKIPTLIGKENVDIEIVAFGPGHQMFKLESGIGKRLKVATDNGVALRVCGMTMKQNNLSEADLYPDSSIKTVPAGSLEIMQKVKDGWFHIRP